jgi:CrcB protein
MWHLFWQSGLVAAGGALGAVTRFLTTRALLGVCPGYIGLGTLTVNVIGSFAIGWILGSKFAGNDDWRVFLVPGLLGGLTTFSALSYETFTLWTRVGGVWHGCAHLAANLILGLGAAIAGDTLARWIGS